MAIQITVDDIKRMHSAIFTLRAEIEDSWPTPCAKDCIWFAMTEAAEAVDAHLDLSALYSRNHSIPEDGVFDELADAAMMLLSAIPEFPYSYISEELEFNEYKCSPLFSDKYLSLPGICLEVSMLMFYFDGELSSQDIDSIVSTTMTIYQYINLDSSGLVNLPDKLNERLERIRNKYRKDHNESKEGSKRIY